MTGDAETIAKEAYAIFRGSLIGEYTPCHWDDLNQRQKEVMVFIAQRALDSASQNTH